MVPRFAAVMAVLAATAGTVAAQPPSAQPPTPPIAPVTGDPRYPVSLADRPLVLPAGVVTIHGELHHHSLAFDGKTFTQTSSPWTLAAGLGTVELRAGGVVHVAASPGDDEQSRLLAANIGALGRLSSHVAAGVTGHFDLNDDAYEHMTLTGSAVGRRRMSPTIATQLQLDFNYGRTKTPHDDVLGRLELVISGRSIVQLSPIVAARFDMGLAVLVADNFDAPRGPVASLDGALVYTSRRVDAFVGVTVRTGDEYTRGDRTLYVGFTGRLQ